MGGTDTDFRDGRLSLAVVAGRLDHDLDSSALQRFNIPAPPIGSDPSFFHPSEQSRLFYNTVDLQVTNSQLHSVAPWRLVDRPQVANADGDFIQPAPTVRMPAGCSAAKRNMPTVGCVRRRPGSEAIC